MKVKTLLRRYMKAQPSLNEVDYRAVEEYLEWALEHDPLFRDKLVNR